jgi:phage-related holin
MFKEILEVSEHLIERFVSAFALKSVIALTSAFFLPLIPAISVMLIIIIIDTILGSWYSLSSGSFTSAGMKKTAVKLTLYFVTIITARLLEFLISPTLDFFVRGIIIYLSTIEVKSILENLSRLGLPIPFLTVLSISNKIPFISSSGDSLEYLQNKDVKTQDRMVKEFYSATKHIGLTKLMKIEWGVWREFSENIIQLKVDAADLGTLKKSVDLEFELALRAIRNREEQSHINPALLKQFANDREVMVQQYKCLLEETLKSDELVSEIQEKVIHDLTNCLKDLFKNVLMTKYKTFE